MILIVSGEDTYRSRQRMTTLVTAFKKKFDPNGYNIHSFSGPSVSFDDVQHAVSTVSFLAKKRLVAFEDFFKEKSSEAQKRILNFLTERDSEEQIILFYQSGGLPGASNALGFVKKAKKELFDLLDERELLAFILKEAKTRGVALDRTAQDALVTRIGPDLWTMTNVLDQLKAYAGKETVRASDVMLFTETVVDENIFHFTDALGAKDSTHAIELLEDQFESGAHPLYLVTMLVRQFRLLFQVRGSSDLRSLKMHPYVLQKTVAQSRQFSDAEIARALSLLHELDRDVKGLMSKDPQTALTHFVVQVTR